MPFPIWVVQAAVSTKITPTASRQNSGLCPRNVLFQFIPDSDFRVIYSSAGSAGALDTRVFEHISLQRSNHVRQTARSTG